MYKEAVKRLKEEGNSIINITNDAVRERLRELRIANMKAQGKKCYEVFYYVNTGYRISKLSDKVYASSSDEAEERFLKEYKCGRYKEYKCRVYIIKELEEKDWE